MKPKLAQYRPPDPDRERLKLAIAFVECGLQAIGRKMTPDKKAELVGIVYERFGTSLYQSLGELLQQPVPATGDQGDCI